MAMSTIKELKNATQLFFDRHWLKDIPFPEWSIPWNFNGTIPNQDKQGCYALLDGNKRVVYIGVGAGKGSARYPGAGLGQELHKYWRKNSKEPYSKDGSANYEPGEQLNEVEAIITIPFPQEIRYLAYALEAFLIERLNPQLNIIGKNRH
jgi:hypothetical protein